MANALNLCLVGIGRVAGSHLAGMLEVPQDIRLCAVVSRDAEKARKATQPFGNVKIYATLEEAVADPEIEAFDICLPNYLHREAAITCLKAHKPVLVEKPLANNSKDASAMVQCAKDNQTILMCGQSRRFYDAVFKTREMVSSGELGRPMAMTAMLYAYLANPPTAWWKSGELAGGLIIPIWGSHILDSALWFFGETPKNVYCQKCTLNPNWEGEDEATIVLGFSGGRHATIVMSWNTRLKPAEEEWDGKGKMLNSKDIRYERRIQCEKGTLMLDDETQLTLDGKVIVADQAAPGNFARELQEFASAIREKRQPMAAGADILPLMRVMDAAMESAKTGKVVEL